MASNAAELKVRVGFLFDEKALAGIERSMRSSGQRLSRLGSDMTLAISAPLAALGVTAVKAAGDLESLTLALKSQLGSAEAAGRELELLNEAAKNPGLGLEQAVRGSVRLQGVGLAADEARETLIQMGNAIAATGGSAVELDNVTKQFAQMISKGRVLQEDVSILSENMPGLAQLMQKAFGTQSVEAIREMGVSGKEFVKRITEAAKELPRVEGGIKNNIGNAIDSLKISAGKLGLALNNAFDISGNIDRLASFVSAAADSFANLSSGTQNLIISLAGIAVAAGPVLKVYGTLKTTGAEIVNIWRTSLVPAAQSLAAWVKQVGIAFNALNFATRAFLLIGIVTAVAALAYEMGAFSRELTSVEKAQQSVNNIQNKAAEAIVEQKSKVDTLVKAYQAEGATLEQKQNILKQLNQIAPEYFGRIKAGTGDIEAITKATAAYTQELLRQAKVTAAKDRLVEIEKALLNLKDTADPTILQTIGNGLLSLGNAGQFAANQAKTLGKNIQQQTADLTAERDALAAVVTQNTLFEASSGRAASGAAGLSNAVEKTTKTAEKYRDVLNDIAAEVNKAKVFGENEDIAKVDALRKGIEKLIEAGFSPASKEVQNLKKQWDALTAAPDALNVANLPAIPIPTSVQPQGNYGAAPPVLNPVQGIGPDMAEQEALAEEWKNVYITAAQQIASTVGEIWTNLADKRDEREIASINAEYGARIAAAEGNAQLQAQIEAQKEAKIAEVRKKAARRAKIIALAEAAINTAVAITKAIASAPPPLNLPAIAAAKILGAAQIATIAATPFARGTSYAPGGVALVGEQGPELINLPRGSQVFPTPQTNQMLNGIGGSGVNVTGEFRVQGTDLVLVLERTQQKNQRFR